MTSARLGTLTGPTLRGWGLKRQPSARGGWIPMSPEIPNDYRDDYPEQYNEVGINAAAVLTTWWVRGRGRSLEIVGQSTLQIGNAMLNRWLSRNIR